MSKFRGWAVWQARAGCYSQAALSSNDLNTQYNGIFIYLVWNPCSKWKVVGECKRKRAQVEPACWMGEKKSLPNRMLATLLVESIPISSICWLINLAICRDFHCFREITSLNTLGTDSSEWSKIHEYIQLRPHVFQLSVDQPCNLQKSSVFWGNNKSKYNVNRWQRMI